MAMQNYTPMRLAPSLDAGLRNDLLKVDRFLRQLTPFAARVPSAPQGTPPASGSFDLLNFLYLPGRVPSQDAFGRVTFETKILQENGTAAPGTDRFGFRVTSPIDGPIDVNISIEEAQTTTTVRPKSPVREWVFPAFNRLDTGPTNGIHFFVDQSDYQQISNKLLDENNYIALEDTTSLGGLFNAAWNKHLAIAWGGSYPAGGFNSSAGTLTTPTGTQPSLQIPSLDYKVQGSASTRDRSHIWCVMKKDHSATPFEPNSFLYGGATGKELYHMLATAAGTLAAASNGYIPYFNNTLNLTVTFNLSSAVVNLDAGSTTGMRPGMRVRQTTNSYSLPEDTYVQSVDTATQFTMTQAWPGSTVSGQTIQVFGPTWENVSAISGSITDVVDNIFNIVDNGDTTKKLAFEVSGVTTATTRTWTVPNFDGTPALFRSGKLRIGDTTAPTHNLEIIAGTTTVAPIRLTSGTSLTAAAAGSIEFTTDNLFFTITTGTARKRLLMADPTGGLTSGRVPFATTNGRLTDDSTFTFGAGTVNAPNFTASGNIQGFLITATSQLDVDSFVSMRSTGIRIGNTSAPAYPIDLLVNDTSIGVFGDIANVTESTFAYGLLIGLTDNNADVQSGERVGLYSSINAMGNAATGSSLGLVAGLKFTNLSQINNVITVGETAGIYVANTLFLGAGGYTSTLALNYGIHALIDVGGTSSGTDVIGALLEVGAGDITVSRLAGVVIKSAPSSSTLAGATVAVAYDIENSFGAHSGATTWYGLRIPSISGPGTIWGIYQSGSMNSAIAGKLVLGSTTAPAEVLDVYGNLKFPNGGNIITDTSTGTKIGTATSQKLSIWNATPIVQPTTGVGAATLTGGGGTTLTDTDTFDGYTLKQVVKALRNIGLLA